MYAILTAENTDSNIFLYFDTGHQTTCICICVHDCCAVILHLPFFSRLALFTTRLNGDDFTIPFDILTALLGEK